jgi:hypothetical protein
MAKEINVLALMKGEEQYIFLFDDKNRTETLRMLGRYAANPGLSFSWYDAAVLSERIRQAFPLDAKPLPAKATTLKSSLPRFSLPLSDDAA